MEKIAKVETIHCGGCERRAVNAVKDLPGVENAVASPLNNGFVEGINNRTKMIKRVMYGRCGIELLAAKIMLPYASKTDI